MDSLIQEAKRRGSGLQVALRRAGHFKLLRRRFLNLDYTRKESNIWWRGFYRSKGKIRISYDFHNDSAPAGWHLWSHSSAGWQGTI